MLLKYFVPYDFFYFGFHQIDFDKCIDTYFIKYNREYFEVIQNTFSKIPFFMKLSIGKLKLSIIFFLVNDGK